MNPALARTILATLRWYVRYAPGCVGKARLAEKPLNSALQSHPRTCSARTRYGTTFTVSTTDVIQRYLYLFGIWEPHLSRWMQGRLRPGDVFIDVGANIGYLSVLASRLVGPSGRVVAIEASPDFYQSLTDHVRDNGCRNVRAVNVAAYDTAERLTFYLESSANLGATTMVRPGEVESTFEVDAQPLSQILTEPEYSRARLIKIDVEGAEAAVVRGLVPLLDRLRRDVELVIEVSPGRLAALGHSADDILGPLVGHGFNLYRMPNDYEASSYPAAWRQYAVPTRCAEPGTQMSDLVFSRIDAAELG